MKRIENAQIGDRVTYNNLNLLHHRGIIIALERGKNGGDCIVEWNTPLYGKTHTIKAEECLSNLRRDV